MSLWAQRGDKKCVESFYTQRYAAFTFQNPDDDDDNDDDDDDPWPHSGDLTSQQR